MKKFNVQITYTGMIEQNDEITTVENDQIVTEEKDDNHGAK